MFLGFFILKFPKSETLLVLLAEAKLVVLLVTLSLKLHNQFGFRACEKFFTNRAVPLLFKCNLLLLRHEPSILLLMNLILLPLHKFSNFLLISLISSSKSWSSRWMTLEKVICISLLKSISLIVVMTFLAFWSVLTLFWISLVLVWWWSYQVSCEQSGWKHFRSEQNKKASKHVEDVLQTCWRRL